MKTLVIAQGFPFMFLRNEALFMTLGCHDALVHFSVLLQQSILSHVPHPLRLVLPSEYGYSFFGR
jgi:hypothetical protein